ADRRVQRVASVQPAARLLGRVMWCGLVTRRRRGRRGDEGKDEGKGDEGVPSHAVQNALVHENLRPYRRRLTSVAVRRCVPLTAFRRTLYSPRLSRLAARRSR